MPNLAYRCGRAGQIAGFGIRGEDHYIKDG